MIGKMLENVRQVSPLVHSITNYVTANDCANILLALGASPVMADDIEDIRYITPACRALCINLGTLRKSAVPAMLKAGKIANSLHIPVLLDPVGAGASKFRTDTAKMLIDSVKLSAIRGNASEIKALCHDAVNLRGVDADTASDSDNEIMAKAFFEKTGAVVIVTGETDYISNGVDVYAVHNGHPMMRRVTGAGCMLSAAACAFLGANSENTIGACLAAVCAMGVCGERAYARLGEKGGNATYRNYIIDEFFNLNSKTLEGVAKYETL